VGGGSTSLISEATTVSPLSTCPCAPKPSSNQSSDMDPCVSDSSSDLWSSNIHPRIMQDMRSFDGFQVSSTATGGPDCAPPEQFSQSMMDTQFSHFCAEAEASNAQEALNTFHPAQPQPFHPYPGGVHSPEPSAVLDSGWQSFMEQLGFEF